MGTELNPQGPLGLVRFRSGCHHPLACPSIFGGRRVESNPQGPLRLVGFQNRCSHLSACPAISGGWCRIRTHGTFSGSLPFQDSAIVHSANHPIQLRATVPSRAFSPRLPLPLPPSGTCHRRVGGASTSVLSLYTSLANLVPMTGFEPALG